MNMISTGAFQTEMDASNRQPTIAEKFAAVWEKKNAKAARAGGVSLMALSLAACGSDDDSASTETNSVVASSFELTPLVDIASTTQALNGSLASDFRFTSGNDTVNGMTATMASTDTLLDGSSTDTDVMNVTVTGATTATTVNIETINLTYSVAAQTFTGANTGTTTYNVSGAVAGNLATPTLAATISLNDYGRVLEIDGVVLTGTAALGSAETINLALSGATHGATAATRTGVQIDGTTNAEVETVNIASNGSAANTFTLSVTNTETIGAVVTSGAQDLTIRVAEGLVDGKTVTGTASTGDVNVSLDTNGNITTNAANWTGVDNIMLRDSATGANSVTLNGLASDQNLVVQNSITTLTPTLQGATFATFKAGADLELNGSSTTAGVTVTTYNGQNVTALDINSTGLATSTATTAANTITNLDGDFTSITITGDTSLAITDLDIEAVQTATTATTARAVVVDASAMTGNAFLSTTASADGKVSYTITGTLNADTIVANASGNVLNGEAGADTLTTGAGADTVTGGAGADHIDMSGGGDNLTGGAGNDTYDLDVTDSAAVAQVGTLTITSDSDAWDADSTMTVTVDGVAATYVLTALDVAANEANTAASDDSDTIAGSLINFLNSSFSQVTATVNANNDHVIDVTADVAGTAFTMTATNSANTDTAAIVAASAATANVAGVNVNSTITDFAAGDIIDIDGIITVATISYLEGAVASQTSQNVHVYTGAAYANITALEVAYDTIATNDTEFVGVFLNDTLGYAQVFYDNDANTQGGEELLMNLTNITNLTDLAASFTADSFIV